MDFKPITLEDLGAHADDGLNCVDAMLGAINRVAEQVLDETRDDAGKVTLDLKIFRPKDSHDASVAFAYQIKEAGPNRKPHVTFGYVHKGKVLVQGPQEGLPFQRKSVYRGSGAVEVFDVPGVISPAGADGFAVATAPGGLASGEGGDF